MSDTLDIKEVLSVLRKEGTVLYPTDTVWGIGCDATNAKAVDKIFRMKERVKDKSMIILAKDINMLKQYVTYLPDVAIELIGSVSDPLTVIYPGARNLPKNVIASDGSIAIRIPRHDFCQDLLDAFGKPIVSTSANISGASNPYSFTNVIDTIKQSVDYVVSEKYQYLSNLKPSTIIKIDEKGEMFILRS